MELTNNLHSSLIILKRINNQLFNAKEGIAYLVEQKLKVYQSSWDNVEIAKINTALFGLVHYSFIWYSAFLDEYHRHLSSEDPVEKQKILTLKVNCKQSLKDVKSAFGDIKSARNMILAHGYRDNDTTPLSTDEINKQFNRLLQFDNMEDYDRIPGAVQMVIQEIEKQFGEIADEEMAL